MAKAVACTGLGGLSLILDSRSPHKYDFPGFLGFLGYSSLSTFSSVVFGAWSLALSHAENSSSRFLFLHKLSGCIANDLSFAR